MDYNKLATKETLDKTVSALKERNIDAIVCANKDEALSKIKEMIPDGASVNNGSSTTLQQLGFVDLLKSGNHKWINLKEEVVKETDPAKQAEARNKALFSQYYLGSVHAVSEGGEVIIASASGSQLPHLVFTSPNIIFVVSTKKICPDLNSGLERIRTHVVPLEDERMKSVGMGGTVLSKILILEKEPAFMNRKVTMIFVEENLGF
ncbi:MAG: hypothetical protein JWN37_645 [Candidatus Nomurabacteria bacterium]|nr:hypothetical protein [Candidatus Nomurabacteria bacterium]